MISIPLELLTLADFLAKLGQFLFGLCTLLLALWAAIFKRKDLFRTELSKKQLEELGNIRASLQTVFFDLYYIPSIDSTMKTMSWNMDQLKEHDPESHEQLKRYQNTSKDLLYKFNDINYYLFPEWFEKEGREKFANTMKQFIPFSTHATISKSRAEREAYAIEIIKMKDYLDVGLRSHV